MEGRGDRSPRGYSHRDDRSRRRRIVDAGAGTTLQVGDSNLLVNLDVPENVQMGNIAANIPHVDIQKVPTDSKNIFSRESFASNTDVVLKGKDAKAQFGSGNRAVITRKTEKDIQKSPEATRRPIPETVHNTDLSTASTITSPAAPVITPDNHSSRLIESQQIRTNPFPQEEALDTSNVSTDVPSNMQDTVQRRRILHQNVGVNTETIPVIARETQTSDPHENQNISTDEVHFQAIRGQYLTQIGPNNTMIDIELNKEFLEEAKDGGELKVKTKGGRIVTITWTGLADTVASLKSSWTLRVREEMKKMQRDLLRLLSRQLFSPLHKLISDVMDKYQARLLEIFSGSLVFVFWHQDEVSAKRMVDDKEGVKEVFHRLMMSIEKGNVDFSLDVTLMHSESSPEVYSPTSGIDPAEGPKIEQKDDERAPTTSTEMEDLMLSMKDDFKRIQRDIAMDMVKTRKYVEKGMNEMKEMKAFMAIMFSQMGISKSEPVSMPSMKSQSTSSGSLLQVAPSLVSKEDFSPEYSDDGGHLKDTPTMEMSAPSISPKKDFAERDKCPRITDNTAEALEHKEPCPDLVTPKNAQVPESVFETSEDCNPQGATATKESQSEGEKVPSVPQSRSRKFFDEAERILSFLNISDIGRSATDKEVKRLAESVAEALVDDDPPPPRAKTMDTVLCLDVSESIGAAGVKDVKRIAISFVEGIQEIAEQYGLEENLAVIALGGRARIVQQLTNDYGCVRDSIERLECGGRSPFLEALSVCVAAIKGRGGVLSVDVAHKSIPPRIIFVTDGLATNDAFDAGPDTSSTDQNTKIRVIRLVQNFSPKEHSSTPSPIIWIPVGNADTNFLGSLAKLSSGSVIEVRDVTGLCSYYRIQDVIGKIYMCVRNNTEDSSNLPDTLEAMVNALVGDLQPEEKEKVVKAVQDKLTHKEVKSPDIDPNDFDDIHEVNTLPPIGTRVIRGPDWTYDDQDNGGTGTVINHAMDSHYLWVLWDFGETANRYRYEQDRKYEVMVAENQPRILKQDELIEIGVMVKRGPDWCYGDRDGGADSVGVVVRKRSDGKVKVRWPNGCMLSCRFGYDGNCDIEVCAMDELMPQTEGVNADVTVTPHQKQEKGGHEKPTEEKPHVLWQWLDNQGQWRLYDPAHVDKLNTEFENRSRGSCLLQKRGKTHRVMFRDPMYDKCIEDGIRREVKRLVVRDEERDELICIEMSIDDGTSWVR